MSAVDFLRAGEYGAAGMYEEPDRSLFYRKALGIRRYYENCRLAEYNGEYLYPSGKTHTDMCIVPNYMYGMQMDHRAMDEKDPKLTEVFAADFEQYHSSVPKEHTVAGDMWTHSMPHYERILKEGLLSYLERISKIEDTELREGLIHLIEGIKTLLFRSISYLESVTAREELILALKKVPLYPAETLYEAIVAWNFILYLDNCDNLGCVASGLYPYYKGEDATEILKNLYDNLDANDGYSMALGMDYNPLTLQCLEASKGKRRPMIELFVDENTPDEIWEKAFEVIRTSNGQPAFYSPGTLLGGLRERFPDISGEDVAKFCGGGCTEAMLAGYSNVGSLDAGINLLLILEQVMQKELKYAENFEDFYRRYIEEVRHVVEDVTFGICKSQRDRKEFDPVPLRTLLVDDCIDNGLEYNNGGARYKWSIINFAGLINVIDSMLVIRDWIFENRKMSAEQMLKCLDENDIVFLNAARQHPVSFGCDLETVNQFAWRVSADIFSMLDQKKPYIGSGFLPASIQFNSQVDAGKNIGATPDGRRAGAPLCDSLGAISGKDVKGPTALLKSVTSLDLKRILGVPVLNFNINPGFDNRILKALVLSYMKLGGIQIQITCISREILEEAYRNPEQHRNLVVRVGGYSEYFARLSDELKRMVIQRTIQEGLE